MSNSIVRRAIRYRLANKQKWRCYYCTEVMNAHNVSFDHIVLDKDGGMYVHQNGVAACRDCNFARGKTLFYFYCIKLGISWDVKERSRYLRSLPTTYRQNPGHLYAPSKTTHSRPNQPGRKTDQAVGASAASPRAGGVRQKHTVPQCFQSFPPTIDTPPARGNFSGATYGYQSPPTSAVCGIDGYRTTLGEVTALRIGGDDGRAQ